MRSFLLWFHIVGAGTWLGANMVQAIAPSIAAKQGPEVTAGWFRIGKALGNRLYMPAGIVVLVTGVFLVLTSDDAYSFGDTFVTIGFAMIAIGIVLGSVFIEKSTEQAAQAVESGDQTKIRQAVARVAALGTIDTLALLFTIFAMVSRLGA